MSLNEEPGFGKEPEGRNLQEDVRIGSDSQQVLRNPVFQRVLADMKTGCYAQFMSVSLNDPSAEQKLLYVRMLTKVVDDFEETFKTLVSIGGDAEEALRRIDKATGTAGMASRRRERAMYARENGGGRT